jgi:hypothetical protein
MKVAAALLALLFAGNTYAQCNLNPRTNLTGPVVPGVPFTISWDAVPEAGAIEIRKGTLSTGGAGNSPFAFGTSTSRFVTSGSSVTDTILTNAQGYVNYQMLAFGSNGTVLCSASFSVQVQSDAHVRSLFERVVVPVAGSITGAHGARFKTALTLTVPASSQATTYSGRIVFHPAGVVSDDDPSMPYSLTAEGTGAKVMTIDDVVGALGLTGLGTLDVIPSASSRGLVPHVQARVYTPEQVDTFTGVEEGSTFHEEGAFIEPQNLEMMQFVHPDPSRYRASIGVRTVGVDPVQMNVVISPIGAPQQNMQLVLQPNTFQHVALESLTGYKPAGGETITVMFRNAVLTPSGMTAVLPYYTITNNNTNDLQIFVGARRLNPTDVSRGFIE